jgi:hypothetical protein
MRMVIEARRTNKGQAFKPKQVPQNFGYLPSLLEPSRAGKLACTDSRARGGFGPSLRIVHISHPQSPFLLQAL